MESPRPALLLWSALLSFSALRSCSDATVAPCGLCEPRTGPPILLPELATDGAERLAWLPGLGAGRAARLVRERPWLGVPLSPDTLALLPGIGEATVREVRAAIARWEALWIAQRPEPGAQR